MTFRAFCRSYSHPDVFAQDFTADFLKEKDPRIHSWRALKDHIAHFRGCREAYIGAALMWRAYRRRRATRTS